MLITGKQWGVSMRFLCSAPLEMLSRGSVMFIYSFIGNLYYSGFLLWGCVRRTRSGGMTALETELLTHNLWLSKGSEGNWTTPRKKKKLKILLLYFFIWLWINKLCFASQIYCLLPLLKIGLMLGLVPAQFPPNRLLNVWD